MISPLGWTEHRAKPSEVFQGVLSAEHQKRVVRLRKFMCVSRDGTYLESHLPIILEDIVLLRTGHRRDPFQDGANVSKVVVGHIEQGLRVAYVSTISIPIES